jgi:serine/threonine protein kinase
MTSRRARKGAIAIDRYSIDRFVGEGPLSRVYHAASREHGDVAVKVLRSSEPVAAARFAREVAVLRALPRSPYLPRHVDDGVSEAGDAYLVLEFIDGISLEAGRSRAPRLSPHQAVAFVAELCRAAEALHRLGVAHGNLTPENVLLSVRGEVSLTGLGSIRDVQGMLRAMAGDAALVGEPASCADPAVLASCGAPEYRAPEHLAGAVDTWTDVFALGAILFELLTGARAFPFHPRRGHALEAEAHEHLASRRVLDEAELLACPGVDGALVAICRGATDPDPQRRHVDARALKEDCLRYLYTGRGPTAQEQLPGAALSGPREPDLAPADTGAGLDEPPTTKAEVPAARADARLQPEPRAWDDETEASSSFARFFPAAAADAPGGAAEWAETERDAGAQRWLDVPTLVDAPRDGRRRPRS